jgi:hypothetical protein
LTDEELVELYGSLRRLLEELPAGKIRGVAGDAGFDLGRIPDGISEDGTGIRRPPILSGIDGQWSEWGRNQRERNVPKLAEAINSFYESKGDRGKVNSAILKHGFRFENGGFVPVNALGELPA